MASGSIAPTGVQIGTGVKAGSVYRITEPGALTQTGNTYDMAITGRGIAWLPGNAMRTELEAGKLSVVDPDAGIDMRIRIYRSMDRVRKRVERLWEYLKEHTPAAEIG